MAQKVRFGALLKSHRQAAGLSQEALAERASLSQRAISDLERGVNRAPRYATLDLLVDALSLSSEQRDEFRDVARNARRSENQPSTPIETGVPYPGIPMPPTRLVGRDLELTQAKQAFLSGGIRLLTLIGPSGVGKTRIALQLAQDLAAHFPDGVVFIPLASIRDAAYIPTAISQHLGIREAPSRPVIEQVQTFLQAKALLLVLDNLEQLLDGSPLIAGLLEGCPRIAILATSRSPLRLRGETELLVAPLPISDAQALFTERAQAIQPDWEYPPTEVTAICTQLDCLPLAIELAAMQVRLFSLTDLKKHLSDRFELLRHGARDLPARQQTMLDAIAWSYDLLTPAQQRCFRGLGAFTGGWTLTAFEKIVFEMQMDAVVPKQPIMSISPVPQENEGAEQPLEVLMALVEGSLVQTDPVSGKSLRFSMLELIREYALIQLRAANEMEAIQRKHAVYYAALAEQAQAMFVAEQSHTNPPLIAEQYNVQAAMQWAEVHHEAILGLRLANYTRLWHMSGQMSQAEDWMERMLATDQSNRVQGLSAAPLAQRIIRLSGFARTLLGHGKYARAEKVIAEALSLANGCDDPFVTGQAWMTRGLIEQAQGRYDEAEKAFAQGQPFSQASGDHQLKIQLLINRAEIARARGNLPQAAALLKQGLEYSESAKASWDSAIIRTLQGLVAHQQQDFQMASAYLREGLERLQTFASPIYIAWCLEGCAATLLAKGQVVSSARLCAVAAHLRANVEAPLPLSEREAFEQIIERIKKELGLHAFSKEWEIGKGLTQAQAIKLARTALEQVVSF